MLILSTNADKQLLETVFTRNSVFDCHLSPDSPDWRQMAIENTVSSYF